MDSSVGAAVALSVRIDSTTLVNEPFEFVSGDVETSTRYCFAPGFGVQANEKLCNVPLPWLISPVGAAIARWKLCRSDHAPWMVDPEPVGKLARTSHVKGSSPVWVSSAVAVVSRLLPLVQLMVGEQFSWTS